MLSSGLLCDPRCSETGHEGMKASGWPGVAGERGGGGGELGARDTSLFPEDVSLHPTTPLLSRVWSLRQVPLGVFEPRVLGYPRAGDVETGREDWVAG